ncbi:MULTISPECIES: DUF4123 domain-containing protein [unclassified Marinobacter]|uniref:DUF4123 domain-containing protein n=1 Tax=unclassified Marinobacter TaxID=83889 RepID=UPI00200E50FA|nr:MULTISPECIES: DUF4123 domain-containing protein [unclassified Marinobacter]UQG56023.1 DUF4123 domain-containing protein [Marinobacter sp. M4C]UQG56649.1 DUF4123 domain-containing protein [Marinobacter sp. M4C]UQG69106.1 DUF4123 domain-containing protein [Marinobacter sp. M1C]UQG69733.1 DUF4123 domain-containing protein [Marinobacter sp. M1C]
MKDATALSHEAQTTTSFYPHADPINAGACWYLVDQAKHPDVLRLLFEHDASPIYDLPYIHTQYHEQAFDGPLIIKPTTNQSEKWLHKWLAEAKALALQGPLLTLEEIRDHLISLNTVRTPYGDSLFRYADTATFGSLGASLSHHQRLRVLGPLTAIHGCYAGTNWSLKKDHSPAHPTEAKEQNPLPLEVTQENLAFVEVYRRDLLAKGLADNNKLAAQTVSCWFQQLTTLGASSEQGLVEGAGLLIAQGFTRALSEAELATVSRTRQRAYWSDTLDALATLTHSQDGT